MDWLFVGVWSCNVVDVVFECVVVVYVVCDIVGCDDDVIVVLFDLLYGFEECFCCLFL